MGAVSWPVVTGIGGIIGGISSIFGGDDEDESMAGYNRARERLANTQANLALNAMEHLQQTYRPVERTVSQYLQSGGYSPALTQAALPMVAAGRPAVDEAYSTAKDNLALNAARLGLQGSGQLRGALSDLERGYATDRTSLYNQGLQQALTNAMRFSGIGQGLAGVAQSGLSSAAGTYGNLSNQAYLQAYNQDQLWNNLAQSLGQLGTRSYQSYQAQPTQVNVTTGNTSPGNVWATPNPAVIPGTGYGTADAWSQWASGY